MFSYVDMPACAGAGAQAHEILSRRQPSDVHGPRLLATAAQPPAAAPPLRSPRRRPVLPPRLHARAPSRSGCCRSRRPCGWTRPRSARRAGPGAGRRPRAAVGDGGGMLWSQGRRGSWRGGRGSWCALSAAQMRRTNEPRSHLLSQLLQLGPRPAHRLGVGLVDHRAPSHLVQSVAVERAGGAIGANSPGWRLATGEQAQQALGKAILYSCRGGNDRRLRRLTTSTLVEISASRTLQLAGRK